MEDRTRLARKTAGWTLTDHVPQIDMARMRAYRLGRVQAELERRELAGLVLFDSINIRYASGLRQDQLAQLHYPGRSIFVPARGRCVSFGETMHWPIPSLALETFGEAREAASGFSYFYAGPRVEALAERWAQEVVALLREHGSDDLRLAADRLETPAFLALTRAGVSLVPGQTIMEQARSIKCEEEIACMLHAITVAEAGIARMRTALEPGVSENQLFALLAHANVAMGGEWCELRLFASGGRTNPWGQEASDRMIRAGELFVFDTDMVGPFGYCADLSRAFLCKPGKATACQKRMYRLAYEHIQHNLELLKPGLTFRELADQGWRHPEDTVRGRYPVVAHGIGMCDEYPAIYFPEDWSRAGYDGVIAENMTLCIESCIAPDDAAEAVKLEQQVVIARDGYQLLSTFPFEDELLE